MLSSHRPGAPHAGSACGLLGFLLCELCALCELCVSPFFSLRSPHRPRPAPYLKLITENLPLPQIPSTVTNSRTAAADLSSAACSSGVSLSSIIPSEPFAPSLTNTPTNNP